MVGQEIEVFVELGKETCGIRYAAPQGERNIFQEIVATGLKPEKAVNVAALMRKYKHLGSHVAFSAVYEIVREAYDKTKLPVLHEISKNIAKLAEWPAEGSPVLPVLNI